MEQNVAEVRGRFEKVEELSYKDPILRHVTKVERCEVRQTPPRKGCDDPCQTQFTQQ